MPEETPTVEDRTPQATIAWAERSPDQVAVEPLDPEVIRRALEREEPEAAPVPEPGWWAASGHTPPMREEQEQERRRLAVVQEQTAGRDRGGRGREDDEE